MDITYYIFAFYIFLLTCGIILVYGYAKKRWAQGAKGSYEKEQRLFELYQEIEDMMNELDENIRLAQTGIEERLHQMEKLAAGMEAAKIRAALPGAAQDKLPAPTDAPAGEPAPAPSSEQKQTGAREDAGRATPGIKADTAVREAPVPPQEAPASSAVSITEQIARYAAQGMKTEDIARALRISHRQVALAIKGGKSS